jgi:hypothetical protein
MSVKDRKQGKIPESQSQNIGHRISNSSFVNRLHYGIFFLIKKESENQVNSIFKNKGKQIDKEYQKNKLKRDLRRQNKLIRKKVFAEEMNFITDLLKKIFVIYKFIFH